LFARSDALAAVEAFQPMDMERTGDGLPRVGIQRLQPPDDPEAKWLVEDIRRAEAEQIAARILAYCDGETTVLDEATKTLRTPNFGDIAILFRTTSNVGIYQEALRRAGIP